MEKRYQFLAIAPSQGIGQRIEEMAAEMPDVEMRVFVGSLGRGVEIVREQERQGIAYDAVIARGATACMIKEASKLPVIEIRISFYDILQAVKLAENFAQSFAIVGFPSVTENARKLKALLQTSWSIYTVQREEDADALLPKLRASGIRLVVSGMALDEYFKKYDFHYVQITTGSSSIAEAITEAKQMGDIFRSLRAERDRYKMLLEQDETEMLLYDGQGRLIFSTLRNMNSDYAQSFAQRALRGHYGTNRVTQKTYDNMRITVGQKEWTAEGETYRAFFFRQSALPYSTQKNDARIFSRASASRKFLGGVNASLFHWKEGGVDPERLARGGAPLLLVGEEGVGKMRFAAWVYEKEERDSQFFVVDFRRMTDKFWTYLVENEESPLNAPGWTFYFRDIQRISAARLQMLSNLIEDTVPYTKNRFLFSYVSSGKTLSQAVAALAAELSCAVLHFLPLRERKEELALLSNTYINMFNVEHALQVSGLTPEAQSALRDYQWPGNLPQFKRILSQLVLFSTGPYIQAEALRELLAAEQPDEYGDWGEISLRGTLEEINGQIVRRVLEECGGNQTQAAKRLGICRTTLWRMLNKR